jgi:hypothetical protein
MNNTNKITAAVMVTIAMISGIVTYQYNWDYACEKTGVMVLAAYYESSAKNVLDYQCQEGVDCIAYGYGNFVDEQTNLSTYVFGQLICTNMVNDTRVCNYTQFFDDCRGMQ